MNTLRVMTFLAAASLLAACDLFDKDVDCDDSQVFNVTVAGVYEGRDSVSYQREIRGNSPELPPVNFPNRFSETGSEQRILVVQGGARIDSSDWFRQAKDGECHFKPDTVTFAATPVI